MRRCWIGGVAVLIALEQWLLLAMCVLVLALFGLASRRTV